jgi:superfamily II DNA or RNA helicase
MPKPKISIYTDGNLMRVVPLPPPVRRILTDALTYTKVRYLADKASRDQNRGKTLEFEQVECWDVRTMAKQRQLFTATGYLDRVGKTLKAEGYKYQVKDLSQFQVDPKHLKPNWAAIKDIELRYGQKAVLDAMLKAYRGRVWYPTGAGKSFLIMLFCRLLPKAKIIVTTKYLDPLMDLYGNIKKGLPSIGISCAKKKRRNRRVMMYSSGTLHHALNDGGEPDIVIADEYHELASDKMFEVLSKFRYAKMLALSANNEDRFDKADFELEGIFGPLIAKMSYEEGVKHDVVTPIVVKWRNVNSSFNPAAGAYSPVERLRQGIWRNKFRNRKIAKDARQFGADDQVLITVKTLEHAYFLRRYLPEFELCYANMSDEQYRFFKEKGMMNFDEKPMTPVRRQMLKKEFETGKLKKVICTTVWKRGVNFLQLGVLIRADGGASAIDGTQIPGRLSRKYEGKNYGLLIDYLDQFDDGFNRQATSRRRDYKGKHWKQLLPIDKRGLFGRTMAGS